MDHWDEDSEHPWNGLLPKINFWNSFWSTWNRDKESSQVNLLWQFLPEQFLSSSQILTVRTRYTMCIDAKSARFWETSPRDIHIHFPPGSIFQPNPSAVLTGPSFINTLCAPSERNFPKLMENNKSHQLTLPKRRIGFSSLDVVDRYEPKHQLRSPYELTNAIISTDERYNDCFLLHSTVPAQLPIPQNLWP